MPNSQGVAGFGTLLKLGDGQASEAFTTIAEVGDIDWSGIKVDMVDITNHSSTGAFKETTPATIDPGTIKFPVNFLPSAVTQGYTTGLLGYMKNKTLKDFQLLFPNYASNPWTFSAYISELEIKAPVNGKLEANFTLTITGVIGFA